MTRKRKSDNGSAAIQASNKKLRYRSESLGSEAAAESPSIPQNRFATMLPALPPISEAISRSVFTHSSLAPNKSNRNQAGSYERLEFVGDAYIELMATRLIWDKFKDLPAGRLSQIRELLVKNETLGAFAVQYGLDRRIQVPSDLKDNAKRWTKVKGDVIEAYVAAIVLEDDKMGGAGFAAAEKWLHELWIPKLESLLAEKGPDLNAKDTLSRKVGARGVKLEYLDRRPMKQLPGGQQTYFVGAYLSGWGYEKRLLGSGQALSRTAAGNLAAEDALQNPLVEAIAGGKNETNKMTKLPRDNGDADSLGIDEQSTGEKTTRAEELVEKKRSMFMSSEFE